MLAAMKEVIASLAAEYGMKADAIRKWRDRGEVPRAKRFDLFQLAQRKGIQVNERDFHWPKPKPAPKPKRRRKAA